MDEHEGAVLLGLLIGRPSDLECFNASDLHGIVLLRRSLPDSGRDFFVHPHFGITVVAHGDRRLHRPMRSDMTMDCLSAGFRIARNEEFIFGFWRMALAQHSAANLSDANSANFAADSFPSLESLSTASE
jgi:hypothetical protein